MLLLATVLQGAEPRDPDPRLPRSPAPLPPTRLPLIQHATFANADDIVLVAADGQENAPPQVETPPQIDFLPEAVPAAPSRGDWEFETYPIDLPSALRLAGANNLQIAFAAERVEQALARVDAADVLWIPSLNFAAVYNNHAGRIQATDGNVLEVSRNSLFVGGGAVLGNSPAAAGSGGPARMFVDLPLVDVIFEPLAARQVACGAEANHITTFNDTLLATTLAYFDLLQANSLVAVAEEAVVNTEELVLLTQDFARSGQGLQADADRAQVEIHSRRREVLTAREAGAVTSAELARLLRIDPATRLVPREIQPMPIELIEAGADVYDLIGQAHALRPELAVSSATMHETGYRVRQERWRPLMPHLYVGFSGGGFGGAPGSSVNNFSDRTDFDVAAIWQMQNLGLGNRARRVEQESRHRQAHLALEAIRDQIAAEVTQAFERVHYRNQQLAEAEPQVQSALDAHEHNLEGIRGGVVRPIEIQQAIGALANARRQFVEAVVDYNRAQFALLRAIGQPATEDYEAFLRR